MSDDPRPETSLKPIRCNFIGFRQSYKSDIYSQLLPGDRLQGETPFQAGIKHSKLHSPSPGQSQEIAAVLDTQHKEDSSDSEDSRIQVPPLSLTNRAQTHSQ